MKLILCLTLLLLAVERGESSCFRKLHPNTPNCKDDVDGTWHEPGESWINADCLECSCSVESMRCCTTYGTPTVYPDDCIAVFDRENCQYRIHKKNDPSVECRVYASVG
ncbi:beta-microseminoprotein-like [Cetorhinus maximus]